jgi:site-specific DNA-methyltransferase (adenine-specific)
VKASESSVPKTAAVFVDVKALTPWAKNPRKNEPAVKAVADSIKRFGFGAPLLARQANGEIIAGHTRLKAAIKLGLTEVPVRYLDLTESEAHALALADNKVGELAEWDDAVLAEVLKGMAEAGDNIEGLGWSSNDLQKMITEPGTEDGEVMEPPAEPITKPGDLWLLGDHRLLCGDSTKAEDVERVMNGERAGAVVTDPPYGMSFQSNHRKNQHAEIAGDGDETLLVHAIESDATHSKYIWCRWDNIPKNPKPKSVVTWGKNNWSMGDLGHEHARQTEVCLFYAGPDHAWPSKRPTDLVIHARTGNDLHPTQKPVLLLAEVIGWTSGLIYDPFLGSGTTLIAAEQLGRKCYGMELSPAYCDVIINRWETLTGKKATLDV